MKIISDFFPKELNKFTDYVLPLTAALIICRAFPVLNFFYFVVPLLLLFTFIFLSRRSLIYRAKTDYLFSPLNPNLHLNLRTTDRRLTTLLLLIAAFGIWAAITSIWSPFPGVSIVRAAYFLLISAAPVLLGYLWSKNESHDLFGFLLPANILVVLVSLYSLVTSSPADAWSGGHGLGFKGYASHQNTLASSIIFTIPSVLFPVLKVISQTLGHKGKNIVTIVRLPFPVILIFILILLLNLYLLLASVSRAGVFSLMIVIVVFFFLSLNLKPRLVFIVILISGLVVLYYSNQSVREFIFKTETHIGDRRIFNLTETIEAAKNGGILGIGYGMSRQPDNERIKGHYENNGKMFVREKMISVLALVEEVGVIGLSLFLAIICYVFWRLVNAGQGKNIKDGPARRIGETKKIEVKTEAAFLIALLIGYCFHAQIEAWWIGVGSIELPVFFLVIGSGIIRLNNWS